MRAITANLGFCLGRSWVLRIASIVVWFFPCGLQAQAGTQSSTPPAIASTSTDYDKLLDHAVEAFEAKDYLKARDFFEQAYVIRPNARVLRGLGISALHLERFGVAKRELTEALRESEQPLTANQREGVTELLSWMRVNLGTLQLQLEPIDAQVVLDGKPVEETQLVLKPGAHHVRVSFGGFTAQEHTLQIAAGRDYTLRVRLVSVTQEAPAPAPSARDAAAAAPSAAATGSARSPLQPSDHAEHEDGSSVFESWWFWTAVGVVVVGGVATGIALAAPAPAKSYEKGGLGGVMMPLGRVP